MKKTAKSLLLVTIMAMILLALTGCGGNKLVATKSSDEYDEKIEVTFKDDKIEKIVMTMEFDDESKAEEFAAVFKLFGDQEGLEVEQKKKKVIINATADAFAKLEGENSDDMSMSKDELKKALEEDGYKVK